jgi:DNA-binding NtrC family response regulator
MSAKSCRICIIETADTTRHELKAALEEAGCPFEMFGNWDLALERMRSGTPFAYVVTNIGEEPASVWNSIEEMHSIPKYLNVRVILYTSHTPASLAEVSEIQIEGQMFHIEKEPRSHEVLIKQILALATTDRFEAPEHA